MLPPPPPRRAQVDAGFQRWRAPSLLLFGNDDPFVDVRSAFEFLETKRTSMQTTTVPAKVRAGLGWAGAAHACMHACSPAPCSSRARRLLLGPALPPAQRTRTPAAATRTTALQLGHMPQEDYAEAIHAPLLSFLRGEELKINSNAVRMTKRGLELVN